jgi:hypothetical protein
MQYAVHQNVAATLPLGIYIILFVMPAVLQYATFSLVTLYFSTVGIRSAFCCVAFALPTKHLMRTNERTGFEARV